MKELTKLIQAQLLLMAATGKLFRADISGEDIYQLYLNNLKQN